MGGFIGVFPVAAYNIYDTNRRMKQHHQTFKQNSEMYQQLHAKKMKELETKLDKVKLSVR